MYAQRVFPLNCLWWLILGNQNTFHQVSNTRNNVYISLIHAFLYYRVIQHRLALPETIYRGTTLRQWTISFSMYKVLWTSQIKAKKMKMEMFYSCIQNLYNLHCYEIIYHSNIGILATNIWARNFQLIFVSALKTFVLGGVNLLQNFHNLNYLK